MEIIQLKNITKKYKDKVIFSDVNLTIPSSSFTVLMGESGSGKNYLIEYHRRVRTSNFWRSNY